MTMYSQLRLYEPRGKPPQTVQKGSRLERVGHVFSFGNDRDENDIIN